jgi:hypothetical protein
MQIRAKFISHLTFDSIGSTSGVKKWIFRFKLEPHRWAFASFKILF